MLSDTDWPRPPLILGLVLGSLAEQNLFLSIDNYGMDWLGFPSVIALFALTVLGTFYPLFQRWREKRNKPQYKQIAEVAELQAKQAVPVANQQFAQPHELINAPLPRPVRGLHRTHRRPMYPTGKARSPV